MNINFSIKKHKKSKVKKNIRGKNKKKSNKQNGSGRNIPVDVPNNVIPTQQWNNPNQSAPKSQYQGGIYTGPPAYGPWGTISVTPTTSNMINNNLKSANPPIEAISQYPGNNRLGNNYSSMPGVSWYNDTTKNNSGPFRIKGVTNNQQGGKKSKKKRGGFNLKSYPDYCQGQEYWSQCGITNSSGGKKKMKKNKKKTKQKNKR